MVYYDLRDSADVISRGKSMQEIDEGLAIEAAAKAAAVSDGWVWDNMAPNKKEHWRQIARIAIQAYEERKIQSNSNYL